MKKEPSESSSTSGSDSSISSGGSEDSVVFFLPAFLVILLFAQGALAGLVRFQKELLACSSKAKQYQTHS